MRTLIAIATLIPTLAFAGGFGNDQQQGQHQRAESNATAHSNAESRAAAKSGSRSDATATSNSGGNTLGAKGGRAGAVAGAAGGSSSSAGGDAASNVDITAGDTTVINDYDRQLPPAANLFVEVCQGGLSGSFEDFGFSNVSQDQYCTLLRMADTNWNAHLRAMDCKPKDIDIPVCRSGCKPGEAIWKDGMPVPKCTARCTKNEASVTYNPPACRMTPEAQHYLELYHKNLADAQELVDDTNATGKADRAAGQALKPVALVAGVIKLVAWLF